ncbi:MAG: hypothetical protein LBI31_05885 [Zoogloeaceae bacterium]|jgi:hypothetical protein|nr:hypothetical protein [Zoogloeaceae bacterium]
MAMVDIDALMRWLPVSSLEPNWVAMLDGFIDVPDDLRWKETITLLEPPAGQHVPYIDPLKALEKLLRRQGVTPEDAEAWALDAVTRMKEDVAEDRWVNFFDDLEPDSPECLSVPDFVAWLRSENMSVPSGILDFFGQAAEVAMCTPMFSGPDNRNEAWSLENLPALPPPKAMIEFVPGLPWDEFECDWETEDNPFLRWREAIRPIALELEKALGEPVYYFKELGDELDDDDVHRFLVLHWCCTCKPESPFVRYLLRISKAEDVEELKAALIDPTSYRHPFKMNNSFVGLEATFPCRINYLPPDTRKTVGVVFLTAQAREVAQSLLAQQIGARAFIVAPMKLATSEWIKQVTPYCRDWTVRYVHDDKLDNPIKILASVDELCVIADEATPDSDSGPVEDLLWLALDFGIEARYYHADFKQFGNPEMHLRERGVPERVAAQKAQRATFTRQLKEIRLENNYGSSGLWDAEGSNLGYDLLDLPFPLVRRIAAWQRDYDETVTPPYTCDEDDTMNSLGLAWELRHEQETLDIAKALQAVLGQNTVVKLPRKQGWMSIDEVVRAGEGKS